MSSNITTGKGTNSRQFESIHAKRLAPTSLTSPNPRAGKVNHFGFKRLPRDGDSSQRFSSRNKSQETISELATLAHRLLMERSYKDALKVSLRGLQADTSGHEKSTLTPFYRYAARACLNLKNNRAAGGFYTQAITQLEQVGEAAELTLGFTLQEYSYFLYREKGYWRALECARRSLKLLERHTTAHRSRHLRRCHFLNARIAKQLYLYPSAYQHLRTSWSMLLAEKKKWHLEHQTTLMEIAETMFCLGQHHAAMDLYHRLIIILLQRKEIHPKAVLSSLRGLADCQQRLGDIESARDVARVAELISIDCFGRNCKESLHTRTYRACIEIKSGRSVWGIRRLYGIAQNAKALGGECSLLAADVLDFLADLTREKPTSNLRNKVVRQGRDVRAAYARSETRHLPHVL